MSMSETSIVVVEGVHKAFTRGSEKIQVLRGVNLEVAAGEFLAMIGPSGSGKSTLLNLIAGLDQPTSGRVIVDDLVTSELTESELARWRTGHVGFVFQF